MENPLNSVSRLCFVVVLFLAGPALSQESPRVTPAVRVISQIEHAVLPIFTNATQSTGTGAVIHESGFVLTADHVTTNSPGIALFGLHRTEYEIVGRVPERDLAVLKVADLSKLKHAIKIGRSNDLQIGEPIIVGGNPGGRGIVFSQGTINSASIEPSWPNILVKSLWRNETDVLSKKRERSTGGRADFIQYDATTNKGNSGGPIVNFDGEIVGLAALKGAQEEGINWAIPIDRIRMFMPYLVPSEEVGAFALGLDVDMLSAECRVLAVREDSAAWNAGLRTGDILKQLNQQSVRTGPEWLISLWGHKAGKEVAVTFSRGDEIKQVQMQLQPTAVESSITSADKIPGVTYQFYDGLFPFIPDYDTLKPTKQGVIDRVDLRQIELTDKRSFSIVFSGYIEFSEPGLIRIAIGSDDGSKLHLNGRLIIDNDFGHGFQTISRWIRVPRGLVPFRVEYMELGGERGLMLGAARDVEGKQPIAMKFLTDKQ